MIVCSALIADAHAPSNVLCVFADLQNSFQQISCLEGPTDGTYKLIYSGSCVSYCGFKFPKWDLEAELRRSIFNVSSQLPSPVHGSTEISDSPLGRPKASGGSEGLPQPADSFGNGDGEEAALRTFDTQMNDVGNERRSMSSSNLPKMTKRSAKKGNACEECRRKKVRVSQIGEGRKRLFLTPGSVSTLPKRVMKLSNSGVPQMA